MKKPEMKKLLLVEDQMIIALSQVSMLEKNGYSVIHTQTGESAISFILNDPSIDLILMDIDLGTGMSGPDAAKKILQIRTLPIVFLTGHYESDIVDKVKSITRYGYIVKDSGSFVLISSIEMAFELFLAHKNIELKIKELDEKEKTFKKIFHASSVLMSVSTVNDNLFTEVNDTFLNKLGYMRSEIIGQPIGLVAEIEEIEKASFLLKNQDSLQNFETAIYTKNGGILYGLCSVDFIKMNGIESMLLTMVDITESKLAREAAERSEAHYHLLANHMSDAVWLMDMNLNTTYCSPSVVKLRGYSTEEIMQIPLHKQITTESLIKAVNVFSEEKRKADADKQYSFIRSIEIEYIRKNETTFWADNTFTLIRDQHGNPESILGEARDITERKNAEARIQKLLREKELLLKEVHHRIKNNMNTIASLLYLQANSPDNKSADAALTEAYNRVQSMMIIYDKLYRSTDFRAISSEDYLSDLIATITSSLSISHPVEIIKKIDNYLLDSDILFAVGIIINELLANAYKYALKNKSGGRIIISFLKNDTGFSLNFRDNGPGIPESIISGESTGFGITLVRLMVQQVKGRMNIFYNDGAEYSIIFPSKG